MKTVVVYCLLLFLVLFFRAQNVFKSCNVKEIHDCLVRLFLPFLQIKHLKKNIFNLGILLRRLHTIWQPCNAL